MMEGFKEYLRGCLSVMKILLSYVIRKNIWSKMQLKTRPQTALPLRSTRVPIELANGEKTEMFKMDNQIVWDNMSSHP